MENDALRFYRSPLSLSFYPTAVLRAISLTYSFKLAIERGKGMQDNFFQDASLNFLIVSR